MADVLDVAAAVVAQMSASGVDDDLTAMKLEKLVYYCQAWHLAETARPLFDDPIEAWAEGPVVRRLWDRHRGFRRVRTMVFGEPSRLSRSELGVVQRVVGRYGRLSAERLSELTHRERPWRLARKGLTDAERPDVTIDLEVLGSSYRRDGASPAEAVDLAVANSRLEWLTTDPAMLPVLEAVARGELDVEDAVKARIERWPVRRRRGGPELPPDPQRPRSPGPFGSISEQTCSLRGIHLTGLTYGCARNSAPGWSPLPAIER